MKHINQHPFWNLLKDKKTFRKAFAPATTKTIQLTHLNKESFQEPIYLGVYTFYGSNQVCSHIHVTNLNKTWISASIFCLDRDGKFVEVLSLWDNKNKILVEVNKEYLVKQFKTSIWNYTVDFIDQYCLIQAYDLIGPNDIITLDLKSNLTNDLLVKSFNETMNKLSK